MARPKSTRSRGPGLRLDWIEVALLCAVYVLVVLLWDTVWVYPLKLVVVYLHEIGHGLAALATGGRVLEIQLHQGEGGHCVTVGGNGFLIYSAGYLGSLAFGVTLLLVSTRAPRATGAAALALGLLLAGTALWLVPLADNAFGKLFGVLVGALVAALAIAPPVWAAVMLRVVAVTSCLYAILDIKSDVLDRPGVRSDAVELAEVTHVPAVVWGILWIVVSIVVTGLAARRAVAAKPRADRVDSPARAGR